MSDFHKSLMSIAFAHAKMSLDPSTKVGAIITKGDRILSWGHNHIAGNIPHTVQMLENREWKYPRVIHAEVHAILDWRDHMAGCHMYVTHPPCQHCAAIIIESGIKEVFTNPATLEMVERWPNMSVAAEMFKEAEVIVNYLNI